MSHRKSAESSEITCFIEVSKCLHDYYAILLYRADILYFSILQRDICVKCRVKSKRKREARKNIFPAVLPSFFSFFFFLLSWLTWRNGNLNSFFQRGFISALGNVYYDLNGLECLTKLTRTFLIEELNPKFRERRISYYVRLKIDTT
jgi:hypothetical protein